MGHSDNIIIKNKHLLLNINKYSWYKITYIYHLDAICNSQTSCNAPNTTIVWYGCLSSIFPGSVFSLSLPHLIYTLIETHNPKE